MTYLKYFFATAALILVPFFALGFYIGPVSGDLTRVGHFSERDFAMGNGQTRVVATSIQDARAPEVIVLGDSFSENIWEAIAMEKSGRSFLTYHWGGLDRANCLEHWVASLKQQYPTARVVLLETIERAFLSRFESEQVRCENRRLKPITLTKPDDQINPMPDPVYALRAARNVLRSFDVPTVSGDTVAAPLKRPDLFTNRRSDLLLYFREDEAKASWTEADIAKAMTVLRRVQQTALANGLVLLVVVVPDKPTTYAQFLKHPHKFAPARDIWAALDSQQFAHVPLRDILVAAVEQGARDLYLPNDTHFGPRGYQLMAGAVAERLAELLRP